MVLIGRVCIVLRWVGVFVVRLISVFGFRI